MRVYAVLNLSTTGMVDLRVGEFSGLTVADVGAAVRTIERNRDLIVGVKVRVANMVVGQNPFPYLKLAREAADTAGTRMVVHIGECDEPLPKILPYFRRGDIVLHCFTGRRNGILDPKGRLFEAVVEARQAGVLFDASSGTRNLAFQVARAAIEQGFPPDIISTDLNAGMANYPGFHMPLREGRLPDD